MHEIDRCVQVATQGSEQVSTNIAEVSVTNSHVAKTATDIVSATSNLTRDAENLRQSIAQFADEIRRT